MNVRNLTTDYVSHIISTARSSKKSSEVAVNIQPRGPFARIADTLLTPAMYVLSGTLRENPQRTHFWNVTHLRPEDVSHLDTSLMIHRTGIPGETTIWPLFHMPIFGGWRNYVILRSVRDDCSIPWHIGWRSERRAGISKIPLYGLWVRMLVGPGDVSFFGISEGRQIPLRLVGTGYIGDGGPFRKTSLL